MNTYKVLKKWGDYKKGSIFTDDNSVTQDEIEALVEKGTLELILPEQKEYKFLVEFGDDASSKYMPGDIIMIPTAGWTQEQADERVADGTIELVSAEEEKQEETVSPVEVSKTYMKQVIISEAPRDINGITYHHIRIADGSEYDLTDTDYKTYVS